MISTPNFEKSDKDWDSNKTFYVSTMIFYKPFVEIKDEREFQDYRNRNITIYEKN
jgi:hypothetical protein